MKKILTIVSLLLISACTVMKPPVNAKRCYNDGECNYGEYCGFYGVDTAPVCKPIHSSGVWQGSH
jgi:hypothetical protein